MAELEQTAIAQRASQNQKIIYVEPNDVYDYGSDSRQQNEQLTPKYEDFCVSFNLIIETFSRFKPGTSASAKGNADRKNSDGSSKIYNIEWGLNREEMYKNRTSVLQGNRGPDELNTSDGKLNHSESNYNYLTTYYTDISFDSYKKKTEIEGLGVESVQISYESWYTPTVVIKFVDVRGSALWGREEAIHVDEHLTAENVFGAFFTMPYPLFRLQVKGFLGKPVTYQLACSNFKGEFNSQTGNFEAVATFIGYSWSLLTDIPFAYLVAAPYATYLGYEYWERMKTSDDWALWHDEGNGKLPPPRLYDLFENIVAALDREPQYTATPEQKTELDKIATGNGILADINNTLKKFTDEVKKLAVDNFLVDDTEAKNKQLLLFSNTENVDFTEDAKKLYDELKKYVGSYENSYDDNEITTKKLPNQWGELPSGIEFKKIFKTGIDTPQLEQGLGTTIDAETLQKISFNDITDNNKLSTEMAKYVAQNLSKVKSYCYLINLYDIENVVNNKTTKNNERNEQITDEINENRQLSVVKLLSNEKDGSGGFKPFIGNVFKVIFCHLETFCHIMFQSAEEIYEQMRSGGRTPTELGLTLTSNDDFDKVDILEGQSENITPWPALYDQGKKSSECGYQSDIQNVYGWPGDINDKHKFIEERVVYALQEGVQRIVEQKKMGDEVASKKIVGFPITPSDYSMNNNVFSIANIQNQADLAGYLAMRITSIFGVLCGNSNVSTELSKELGKIDAYNLYTKLSSINSFQNVVQNIDRDVLVDIMCCNDTEKSTQFAASNNTSSNGETTTKYRYEFEISKNISKNKNGRHPFFDKSESDNLEYIHFYDKNNISYIPSKLRPFKDYQGSTTDNDNRIGKNDPVDILYNGSPDKLYFTPNYTINNEKIESRDWLHTCDSTKIDAIENYQNYTNKYMFNIVTDEASIKSIRTKYQELSGSGNKVGDYEIKDDLTEFLNKFVKIGGKNTAKYFKGVVSVLSANAEKLKLDKERFLPETTNNTIPVNFNYGAWVRQSGDDEVKNDVSINEDGVLKFTGSDGDENIDMSQLVIQQLRIYYVQRRCNIFGCPFYYMQNDTKVKALLFLHTFKYNFDKINLNVFSPNKINGATEEVPKAYLLLIGGLLWRKKQDKDPIIFTDSTIKLKTCEKDKTLFSKINNEYVFFANRLNDDLVYNYSISDLLGGADIDWNIENQLITLFEDFANTTFNNIANKYEISIFKTNCDNISRFIDSVKHIDSSETNFKYNDVTYDKTPENIQMFFKASGFKEVVEKYSSLYVHLPAGKTDQGINLLFNEKDTEYQSLFKDLYTGTYIVSDSCYRRLGRDNSSATISDTIYIKKSTINNYLDGFNEACKAILGKETTYVAGEVNLNVSKDVMNNRDLSLAIYYYLKNLWDKWLVCSKTDAFTVKNFFEQNFIFTDSFYRNTYHELAINCESIVSAWKQLADNGSLFHFLSKIVSDHGCIFLPVPDYVGFNGETQQHDIEVMNDLFRPLPYNAMEDPKNSNKFVIMYTHSPSHVKDNSNAYPTDSYDIWSHETNSITTVASKLFSSKVSRDSDAQQTLATREGYNVPSFGVSFAKQNNHIFKNLRLTMDNPVMTEQAIKAQWQIALKGSSETNTIAFLGQDTFNVFTNYSYTIDIEMMGNAQICPLMYFQLTNVPMWRGTYMIFKVVHTLTPGNMTTTITAMKMNKYAQPFNTQFFTPIPHIEGRKKGRQYEDDCGDDDVVYLQSGDVVGLVGDSYAYGMSKLGKFVEKAAAKGITAKAPRADGNGNLPSSNTTAYCQGGAHTDDTVGARNAANDGCTVIVVHLGLNYSSTSDIMKNNLVNVVNVASSKGAKVLLCIPTCPARDDYRNNNNKKYNEIVAAVQGAAAATKCGIIDLRVLQDKIGVETAKNDQLHPYHGYNDLAQEIINQLVSNGVASRSQTLTYNGGNNVTNERMKKILSDTNRAKSTTYGWYTLDKSGKVKNDNGVPVSGVCTSGPTTWYARADIHLSWWNPKGVATSEHVTTGNNFTSRGFKMVWHGTPEQAKQLKSTQFAPGDVCTLHAYNGSGKATSHGAMWTGSEWRSDFIQNGIWVYPGGRGRDGDYSVCIWRHPDLQ